MSQVIVQKYCCGQKCSGCKVWRESRRPEKPHTSAPIRAGLRQKNFGRGIKQLFCTERRLVNISRGEQVEAEIEPIYGEGGEVLNSAEMRNFLARVWTDKFGHGNANAGERQPRPGVAPATMSDYLRDEYRKVRGRSRRG